MDKVFFGDCRDSLRALAADGVRVQMCVTSPPYFGLRDYGVDGQIGLEETPEQYIAELVEVFRCVRDVLADDGTLWVNIGDSYGGKGGHGAQSGVQFATRMRGQQLITKAARHTGGDVKEKDLIGIPWMLAFALRADGWYLRQEIIWHKPAPMPESVTDRCTKAHESLFLLAKSRRYYFDHEAIKEPAVSGHAPGNNSHKGASQYDAGNEKHRTASGLVSYAQKVRESKKRGEFAGKNTLPGKEAFRAIVDMRNKRSVWTINTKPYAGAHFAVFPEKLVEPCIFAGSRPGDIVLDPFMGSGTTAAVSKKNGRQYIGCELNADYKPLQDARIAEALAPGKPIKPPKPVPVRRLVEPRRDMRTLDLFAEFV